MREGSPSGGLRSYDAGTPELPPSPARRTPDRRPPGVEMDREPPAARPSTSPPPAVARPSTPSPSRFRHRQSWRLTLHRPCPLTTARSPPASPCRCGTGSSGLPTAVPCTGSMSVQPCASPAASAAARRSSGPAPRSAGGCARPAGSPPPYVDRPAGRPAAPRPALATSAYRLLAGLPDCSGSSPSTVSPQSSHTSLVPFSGSESRSEPSNRPSLDGPSATKEAGCARCAG